MNHKTNYGNTKGKSVWDLYVENFRDHIWDLTPKLGSSPLPPEEELKERSKEKKRINKKLKDLTRPPFKVRKKSGEKDS